jgi:hypothetical protein
VRVQIHKNINDAQKKTVLDVGGTVFKVTKDTLLRFPHTYFRGLLGSGEWKPDGENGEYFIDRDPFAFDIVLRYLRGAEIDFMEMSEDLKRSFRMHCNYFLLPIPQSLLSMDPYWWKEQCRNEDVEINGNVAIAKTALAAPVLKTFGSKSMSDCESLRLKVPIYTFTSLACAKASR